MIRNKSKKLWLGSLTVVFLLLIQACKSRSNESNKDSFDVDNDLELTDGKQSSRKPVPKSAIAKLHPKKQDAWHTRKLLMQFEQPSPQKIIACKDFSENLALNANNLRALNEASETLSEKVERNMLEYHWCFYQLMADLDLYLERDTPLLTEKKDFFLKRSKVLWVISEALDQNVDGPKTPYGDYLRNRYIAISQNIFGRNLEIVETPTDYRDVKPDKPATTFADP
jgi:hypothetical protein